MGEGPGGQSVVWRIRPAPAGFLRREEDPGFSVNLQEGRESAGSTGGSGRDAASGRHRMSPIRPGTRRVGVLGRGCRCRDRSGDGGGTKGAQPRAERQPERAAAVRAERPLEPADRPGAGGPELGHADQQHRARYKGSTRTLEPTTTAGRLRNPLYRGAGQPAEGADHLYGLRGRKRSWPLPRPAECADRGRTECRGGPPCAGDRPG